MGVRRRRAQTSCCAYTRRCAQALLSMPVAADVLCVLQVFDTLFGFDVEIFHGIVKRATRNLGVPGSLVRSSTNRPRPTPSFCDRGCSQSFFFVCFASTIPTESTSTLSRATTNRESHSATAAMASDEIVWDIINNQFCSYKIKYAAFSRRSMAALITFGQNYQGAIILPQRI